MESPGSWGGAGGRPMPTPVRPADRALLELGVEQTAPPQPEPSSLGTHQPRGHHRERGCSALRRNVLLVAALGLTGICARATLTSASPVASAIANDVGVSLSQLAILGSAAPVLFAVAAAAGTALPARLPVGRAAAAALLLIAAVLAARSASSESSAFLVLTVVAFIGMGLLNVLIPPLIRSYLPERVAAATSWTAISIAIGSALPPTVATVLSQDWRASLLFWAAVALLGAICWFLAPSRPETSPVMDARAGAATGPTSLTGPARPTRRQRPELSVVTSTRARRPATYDVKLRSKDRGDGVRIGVLFGASAAQAFAMFSWLPHIAMDQGASVAFANLLLSVYAITALPSALIAPPLALRSSRAWAVPVLSLTAFTVGITAMMLVPLAMTPLAVAIAGLGQMLYSAALTDIGSIKVDPARTATISSAAQTVGYLGGALGPMVVLAARCATDSWLWPLGALVILSWAAFPCSRLRLNGRRQ